MGIVTDREETTSLRKHHISMDDELTILSSKFFLSNVADDNKVMLAVNKVKDIIRDSNLAGKAFACGPTFVQYEGLMDMENNLVSSATVFFVVNWIMSWGGLGFRLGSAFHLSWVMMVVEMWGIMLFSVKLNVFSALAIMMTTILSPVFTIYLVVAFKANPHLPPDERLSAAMQVSSPAILQGSLGILCASLPLFMSQAAVLAQCFGLQIVILVLLGIFHGLVVSPVLLAVISQNETVLSEVEKSECVGPAVEVAVLQGGPNLLESSPPDKVSK